MSAPLSIRSFLRAILHIDGDAFFASCEQSRRPALQGRPVVTGKERGTAASMSYEAKARGVTRGMRIADIRKVCKNSSARTGRIVGNILADLLPPIGEWIAWPLFGEFVRFVKQR
jgi:nucleotidyltransferase/DNA polymerase involved in DNA repair